MRRSYRASALLDSPPVRPDARLMPLFRRNDGELLGGLPPVRRIMQYLMRTRAESVVLSETVYDVARARQWLAA